MNTPQEISKLAAALVKVQGQLTGVLKTGKNPHLNSDYATLDDIIGTIREPLSENGLAFSQFLGSDESGGHTLTTMLIHESGQSLSSTTPIGAISGNRGVNDLQALGSAITYMKRYALSAMLGIATDTDTDGHGIKTGGATPKQRQKQSQPAPEKKATAREAGKDPLPPDVLRGKVRQMSGWVHQGEDNQGEDYVRSSGAGSPIAGDTRQHVTATLIESVRFDKATDDDLANNAKLLLEWMFTVTASASLTEEEGQAILYAWQKPGGGLNEYAATEAIACIEAALEAKE